MLKIIIVLLSVFFNFLSHAEKINIYIPDEPYLSYYDKNDAKIKGFSIDVLRLLRAEVDDDSIITQLPQAIIKSIHTKTINSLFIEFYKDKSNVNSYQQVGIISEFSLNVYKLQARNDIIIKSFDDIKKYTFGVVRYGGRHEYFKSVNFNKSFDTHVVTTDEQNILRFFMGRTDLLIENPFVLKYLISSHNLDSSLVEKVYPLKVLSGHLGIFFSLNTNIALVKKYQAAFNKIKQTDEFNGLLEHYSVN